MQIARYARLFMIFLAFQLIFSSCEDSDDPIIVGTWTLTQRVFFDCEDDQYNHIEEAECNEDACDQITFRSNGTWESLFIDAGDHFTNSGTYIFRDDVLEMCEATTDPCDEGLVVDIEFKGRATFLVRQHAETPQCKTESTYKKD